MGFKSIRGFSKISGRRPDTASHVMDAFVLLPWSGVGVGMAG